MTVPRPQIHWTRKSTFFPMSEAGFSDASSKAGKISAVPLPFAPAREVRYNLSMIATHHDRPGAGLTRIPPKAGFSQPLTLP